jgi:hypothetical protein
MESAARDSSFLSGPHDFSEFIGWGEGISDVTVRQNDERFSTKTDARRCVAGWTAMTAVTTTTPVEKKIFRATYNYKLSQEKSFSSWSPRKVSEKQ